MPKRSTEEIIAAIRRCISGESGQTAEARILAVPVQTLQDWIRKYETFGTDGFLPKAKKNTVKLQKRKL